MTEIRNERRRCTRVALDLPAEVHQGGSMWPQRLIDISLSGVATDQPDLWDAQYNEPFSLIIKQLFPIDAGLLKIEPASFLYVSRGSGTWGPPIRFLAPPEVTIFELIYQHSKQ